jgi:hypothetical protein
MSTYGNTVRLIQEKERLRGEISDLTALLAEAIDLIRYPNDHDVASFLKRVTP